MQTLQNVGSLTAALGPMAGGYGYAGATPASALGSYTPAGGSIATLPPPTGAGGGAGGGGAGGGAGGGGGGGAGGGGGGGQQQYGSDRYGAAVVLVADFLQFIINRHTNG